VLDAVGSALRSGRRVYVVGDLRLPPEGRPPAMLPPVSRDLREWPTALYLESWMTQLGFLLRAHARDGRMVEVREWGPVSNFESLPLGVFEGWRP